MNFKEYKTKCNSSHSEDGDLSRQIIQAAVDLADAMNLWLQNGANDSGRELEKVWVKYITLFGAAGCCRSPLSKLDPHCDPYTPGVSRALHFYDQLVTVLKQLGRDISPYTTDLFQLRMDIENLGLDLMRNTRDSRDRWRESLEIVLDHAEANKKRREEALRMMAARESGSF